MPGEISNEAILEETERLARSVQFTRSARLLRFVRFTVEETLAGRAGEITESIIAAKVYDRKQNFNPQVDAIVRTEARRLRAKLEEYYRTTGRHDPIIIEYPLGAYAPVFRTSGSHQGMDFLQGGGEMVGRIAAFPWGSATLDPISKWPPILKTAVSICLRSRFPTGIFWGPELLCLYNDTFRDFIGSMHPTALGRPAREGLPALWQSLGHVFERVMERNESAWSPDEQFVLDRDGYAEECHCTVSASPINDGSRVTGVLVALSDTTAHLVQARRSRILTDLAEGSFDIANLDEACHFGASILRKSPKDIPFACVYLFEAGGLSARLRSTAGVHAGTPISPSVIQLNDDRPSLLSTLVNSRTLQILNVGEKLGRLSAGGSQPLSQSIAFLPIPSQVAAEPAGFILAGVNPQRRLDDEYRHFLEAVAAQMGRIIAQVQAGIQEREYAQSLAELRETETSLIAQVSGQIREPLTVMSGALDQIAGSTEPSGTTLREAVATAGQSLNRLLKVADVLSELSQLDAARRTASYRPTDLSRMTAEVANSFRALIGAGGIEFIVDCRPLGEPVYVDPEMWRRIVAGLLANAFKHTSAGQISLSLRLAGERLALAVTDTGLGIGSVDLSRIFDPFYILDRAEVHRDLATPVSLPIIKEMVVLHGGNITVMSEERQGSRFVVTIPRGMQHLPPDRVSFGSEKLSEPTLEQARPREASHSESQPPARAEKLGERKDETQSEWSNPGVKGRSGLRILVACRDPELRRRLQEELSLRGLVEALGDDESALSRVRREHPDLVLADSRLPGVDGVELVRALRSDPEAAEIPVVLFSSEASEEERLQALALGADEYILRPATSGELTARVAARLAAHEARVRANAATRTMGQRYHSALDAGDMGAWEWDIANDTIWFSPELRKSWLLPKGVAVNTRHEFLMLVHPEDRNRVKDHMDNALKSGSGYEVAFRNLLPDGSSQFRASNAKLERDSSGRPVRLIGIDRNVRDSLKHSGAREQ